MKKQHFMIDLETLDTRPTAVVLSYAFVHFNPKTGEVFKESSNILDIEEQLNHGRTISFDTLKWWQEQGRTFNDFIEERKVDFTEPKHTDATEFNYWAMCDFDFFGENAKPSDEIVVWANGVDFDLSIMQNVDPWIGSEKGWKYWNQRDLRTLMALFPEERKAVPKPENRHDPLVDCHYQIAVLKRIWNRINPTGE